MGRDEVGEEEGDVVDGDVVFIEEHLGVHLHIHAGEDVGVVTAGLQTPGEGRPDRDQVPGSQAGGCRCALISVTSRHTSTFLVSIAIIVSSYGFCLISFAKDELKNLVFSSSTWSC